MQATRRREESTTASRLAHEEHLVRPGREGFQVFDAARVVEMDVRDLEELLQTLHDAEVLIVLAPSETP